MAKEKGFDKISYNNSYIAKAYDRVNLTLPKGEKEVYEAHAAKLDGGSLNAFIRRAMQETMARDNAKE